MFEKMKKYGIAAFSFLWVALMASLLSSSYSQMGGAELPGAIAFLLFVGYAYLIIKGHPIISAVASTVILAVARIIKFGPNVKFWTLLFYGVLIMVIAYFLFKSFNKK